MPLEAVWQWLSGCGWCETRAPASLHILDNICDSWSTPGKRLYQNSFPSSSSDDHLEFKE